MNAILVRGGQLAGLLGILLMLVSVAGRLTGRYTIGDFQAGTLMVAGAGVVTVGCFLLLWAIAGRLDRG
jgi:hypothetical protein